MMRNFMFTEKLTVSVGTSHDIENDLIGPILSVVMNKIKGEVKQTSVMFLIEVVFVDVSEKWQPPSILCYVIIKQVGCI